MLLMIFVSGTLLEALGKLALDAQGDPGGPRACHWRCRWFCGPLQCFYSLGSRHDLEHRNPSPHDVHDLHEGQNMKRFAPRQYCCCWQLRGLRPLGDFAMWCKDKAAFCCFELCDLLLCESYEHKLSQDGILDMPSLS